MKAERWQAIKRLFDRALELPESERAGYLRQVCASDSTLRLEVELLLAADRDADGGPLEHTRLTAPTRRLAELLDAAEPADEEQTTTDPETEHEADRDTPHVAQTSTLAALGESGERSVFLEDGEEQLSHEPVLGVEDEKYELLHSIGEGGMATVYLAFDRDLKRHVALKVMKGTSDTVRRRFLDEAQVVGQLEHAGIVSVHELGSTTDGRPYYAMRYIKGHSLKAALERLRSGDSELVGRYTPSRLIRLFLRVTDAVRYAHARGVVHRDLKPANVMLGDYGATSVVDWGLAKVFRKTEIELDLASGLTGAQRAVGTPGYMAPEQVLGDKVDARADVYSLGVLLYELLTLELPFSGSSIERAIAHVHERPQPPRDRAPSRDIPRELERVCLKALSKHPEDRYPTAEGMHQDVRAWLDAQPTGQSVDRSSPGAVIKRGTGIGGLALESIPSGAEVVLQELVADGAALRPVNERSLGTTPCELFDLPQGSYLVVLRKEAYRDGRYPVAIEADRESRATVSLYSDEAIGSGFVHVPAGPCIIGSPLPASEEHLSRTSVEVADFFIARHPITVGELREFLHATGRDRNNGGAGAAKATPRAADPFTAPAVRVTWSEAVAFCAWRSERDGRRYRLPSEIEWEKAARGVDERPYPWGRGWSPDSCNMRLSRAEPAIEPVEARPRDLSVYGVLGLAGNVQDWTSSASDPSTDGTDRLRVVRGGGWRRGEPASRAYRRFVEDPELRDPAIGFRLALDPEPLA